MKMMLPYLIMIVFLALFAAAIIYVSRRFAFYFNAGKAKPWYITFTVLFVLMIAGGMAFQNAVGLAGHVLYILSAALMGFLLYLMLSVIVVDLVRLIVKVKPIFYGIAVVLLAASVSIYGIFNANTLKTTTIDIPIKGLTKELKIMHLSDIHIGHFRDSTFVQEIVNRTNRQDADMIFITGDYLDGKIALKDENFESLEQLNAPTFFIGGNHDEYTGLEAVKIKMRSVGVKVMENEIVNFDEIQIVGLDYMIADKDAFDMHPSAKKLTLKEVLQKLEMVSKKPTILLHHSPVGLQYASERGVDLYLAGHTHGGQVFPFTLINTLFFPYNSGLFDYQNMKVFVSEGAGTFGPPMRVGTKSEITVITLKPGN
jgi:hypothetical protein